MPKNMKIKDFARSKKDANKGTVKLPPNGYRISGEENQTVENTEQFEEIKAALCLHNN